jgi:hypothetical protein
MDGLLGISSERMTCECHCLQHLHWLRVARQPGAIVITFREQTSGYYSKRLLLRIAGSGFPKVVQLVRTPACQVRGHGFESRRSAPTVLQSNQASLGRL